MEKVFAKLLKRIIELKTLPNIDTEEYIHLLMFIFTQESRTSYKSEQTNETINKITQEIFKNDINI